MKKAGSVFLGLIIRTIIVICGIGLYLQDLIGEYLYYWFGLNLNSAELVYLFLAVITTIHILFLLIKLIAALFRNRNKPHIEKHAGSAPKNASQTDPARFRTGNLILGIIVWVIVLSCAVGLFMEEAELGFFFLASVHAIYVTVLLVRMIVILIRNRKMPEPRKRSVDPPEARTQSVEPPSPPPVSPKYCSACGAGLEPGDRYCPQCGQRLSLRVPGGKAE